MYHNVSESSVLILPSFRRLDFTILFMFSELFLLIFFFPVCACFPKITFALLKIRVVSWMLVKPGLVGVKGMEHVNLRNSTAVYNVFIVSGHRKIAIKNQGLWCYFYCLALAWLLLQPTLTTPLLFMTPCLSPLLTASSLRLHPDTFHIFLFLGQLSPAIWLRGDKIWNHAVCSHSVSLYSFPGCSWEGKLFHKHCQLLTA